MRGEFALHTAEAERAALELLLRAWEIAKAAGASAKHRCKKVLAAALAPVERALLSAPGRERIHAAATFIAIFLFAVTSVDFLIVGGGEFARPARAAPRAAPAYASAAPANPAPPRAEPREEIAPMLSTEARVTPVSQIHLASLSTAEPAPRSEPQIASDIEAALGGEAAQQAALEGALAAQPQPPRKTSRRKGG